MQELMTEDFSFGNGWGLINPHRLVDVVDSSPWNFRAVGRLTRESPKWKKVKLNTLSHLYICGLLSLLRAIYGSSSSSHKGNTLCSAILRHT